MEQRERLLVVVSLVYAFMSFKEPFPEHFYILKATSNALFCPNPAAFYNIICLSTGRWECFLFLLALRKKTWVLYNEPATCSPDAYCIKVSIPKYIIQHYPTACYANTEYISVHWVEVHIIGVYQPALSPESYSHIKTDSIFPALKEYIWETRKKSLFSIWQNTIFLFPLFSFVCGSINDKVVFKHTIALKTTMNKHTKTFSFLETQFFGQTDILVCTSKPVFSRRILVKSSHKR